MDSAPESILARLGLPDGFGYALLMLALALLLAPYLRGSDFGLVKIPNFEPPSRRTLRIIGPLLMAAAILAHAPILVTSDRVEGSEREHAIDEEGPLQPWASQIAAGSRGITADSTRGAINARWQTDVLPFCQMATQGRYPFDPHAEVDMALTDFSRLFGAGGLIDGFFQKNLAEHVDTRIRPWTWKQVGDTGLGISDAVLAQMQNAAQIRDAFFAGGANLAVSFQITPEALDPNAAGVGLEIDGQKLGFLHGQGQPRPTAITWPGEVGVARVLFVPERPGSESLLFREGPWAWFRLLDAAEVRNTSVSDRKRIIFNVGGRIATFQMQASTVLNPFALPALHEFSCPASF